MLCSSLFLGSSDIVAVAADVFENVVHWQVGGHGRICNRFSLGFTRIKSNLPPSFEGRTWIVPSWSTDSCIRDGHAWSKIEVVGVNGLVAALCSTYLSTSGRPLRYQAWQPPVDVRLHQVRDCRFGQRPEDSHDLQCPNQNLWASC